MFKIPLKTKEPEKSVEQIAVTPADAAKMLGISERTLWALTKNGLIPHRRVGKRILYSVEALKAFVAGEEKKE